MMFFLWALDYGEIFTLLRGKALGLQGKFPRNHNVKNRSDIEWFNMGKQCIKT